MGSAMSRAEQGGFFKLLASLENAFAPASTGRRESPPQRKPQLTAVGAQ
jgi:hypothetical protein